MVATAYSRWGARWTVLARQASFRTQYVPTPFWNACEMHLDRADPYGKRAVWHAIFAKMRCRNVRFFVYKVGFLPYLFCIFLKNKIAKCIQIVFPKWSKIVFPKWSQTLFTNGPNPCSPMVQTLVHQWSETRFTNGPKWGSPMPQTVFPILGAGGS